MDDNVTVQLDEIEALTAIYGSQWEADSDAKNCFTFHLNSEVKVFFTLHKDYPSDGPPEYQLLAPTLSGTQKEIIGKEFETIFKENSGTPIIFQCLEKLKEIVKEDSKSDEKKILKLPSINEKEIKKEVWLNFNITHGPIIEDRKSVFQGHACAICQESEVGQFLILLKQNKKISQATHNIIAYRINNSGVIYQDYDDDGETHAGQRLLHLLQIVDVTNVVVVVSRWYGGIHLGPKRFQHINNSARQALQQAGFIK